MCTRTWDFQRGLNAHSPCELLHHPSPAARVYVDTAPHVKSAIQYPRWTAMGVVAHIARAVETNIYIANHYDCWADSRGDRMSRGRHYRRYVRSARTGNVISCLSQCRERCHAWSAGGHEPEAKPPPRCWRKHKRLMSGRASWHSTVRLGSLPTFVRLHCRGGGLRLRAVVPGSTFFNSSRSHDEAAVD